MSPRLVSLNPFLLFLLTQLLRTSIVSSTTFIITNKCDYTVWPGILSNADSQSLSTTGFALQTGETTTISAPASWGGRMWGRSYCSQDDSTGKFSCLTGDCGSGKVECSDSGATPPATLAEFKLDGYGGLDYFDVSLVDGYNLPMLVVPQGGQNCSSTGCIADLNSACPTDLKVSSTSGESVACRSACEAFRQDEYCCSGAHATPDSCKASYYSQIFKSACPHAYSYAYDDKTSTFTCANSGSYEITFCPSPSTSQKSSQGQKTATDNTNGSTVDSTMVYQGAYDQSDSCQHVVLRWHAIAAMLTTIVSISIALV